MTVSDERKFEIASSPDAVWEFMADPEHRARSLSIVEDFERVDDTHTTWYLSLPIPAIDETVALETKDTHRDAPTQLAFVGRSDVGRIEGEHEFEAIETGTRITNRMTVEGSLPGVETYFERNLDEELTNLETALQTELETDSDT